MRLNDAPIRRKLMVIILLTTVTALLLMRGTLLTFEFLRFKQSTTRQLSTMGKIMAANSTAALAFANQDDAVEILSALKAEPYIIAAALYDHEGNLFSKFPLDLSDDTLPAVPRKDGIQPEEGYLAGFHPVVQGSKRLGTLYLRFDVETLKHEWLRLSIGITLAVIAVVILVAYLLSRKLQHQISQPILALAETARAISDRRDYSVRARKLGDNELGLLTDAFNQMLARIQEQNLVLSDSEARVRAVLDSSINAVAVINSKGEITDWNARAKTIFGWTHEEVMGRDLAEIIIPPRHREAHRRGMKHLLATGEGPVLNRLIEMSAIRRDGSEFPVEMFICPLKTGDTLTFCGFISDITARKEAETKLRESQQLLAAIIDNSQAVIYVKDLEGRYLLVNRRWSELFHLSQEATLGRTDHDFFSKESADAFRAMDQEVMLANRALTREETAPHDDGMHTYISIKCPLWDDAGNPYAVFGISTDITERKQADEKIAREQARFKLMFESVPVGIAFSLVQPDGQYTRIINDAHLRICGLTREQDEMPGIYGRLTHPDDAARQRELSKELGMDRVGKVSMEKRYIKLDGELVWVAYSFQRRKCADGNFEEVTTIVDITRLKQAEEKLQAQLERLNLLHHITRAIGERQDMQSILQVVVRSLEDNLPVDFSCVCLYDQSANTLKVVRVGIKSEPTAMELAMTEQAVIPIDENGLAHCVRGQLVYEPDISEVPFPFPQRLTRGGLRSLVIAPLLVESKVFGVLVAARRKPQGFISGECEFLKQVSEHVALASHQAQLYTALQQAYDDLRQTQQAVMQQERLRVLGQMASGIAHDINNAISPVALYTESLLETEPNLSVRARDYLQTIRQAIHDVAETVARMREFYRQREPQLTLTPVRLNLLAQQVMDLTRARWSDDPQRRGVVIRTVAEMSADLPDIMGVESEIRDALTNLVFNAVDAMPDGGTLTLRTLTGTHAPAAEETLKSHRICIEVSDTGVGMDEDTRRRCLEPFFTTKGERGTGLGLAMVYGMVQRHSADIVIESAPGKGTTVRLSFPVYPRVSTVADQPMDESSVPSRLNILVVDDDPLLIKSLRNILEADGHVVITAGGGQEGIDSFCKALDSNAPFAVVITDLGMPYVDGRKVANAVKAASPSTPVILLTGWGQRLVAEGEVPPHVDRVLNKPPKLRDLREALARCCPQAKN
jgi:PAS domain S-box-containing protein